MEPGQRKQADRLDALSSAGMCDRYIELRRDAGDNDYGKSH
jgi:hypothetical protein